VIQVATGQVSHVAAVPHPFSPRWMDRVEEPEMRTIEATATEQHVLRQEPTNGHFMQFYFALRLDGITLIHTPYKDNSHKAAEELAVSHGTGYFQHRFTSARAASRAAPPPASNNGQLRERQCSGHLRRSDPRHMGAGGLL